MNNMILVQIRFVMCKIELAKFTIRGGVNREKPQYSWFIMHRDLYEDICSACLKCYHEHPVQICSPKEKETDL